MNDQLFESRNDTLDGMPAGGEVRGTGLSIHWQAGPLGRGEDRKEPNGAFVETVIRAVIQRLHWHQQACDGRFACAENTMAIECLVAALGHLNWRTQEREARGVEGTHEP